MKVLVTGGAGFVGSRIALLWKRRFPRHQLTCFDSLKRRGSELSLAELTRAGIKFVHGDIRCPEDFGALEEAYDVMIEASAEPSVHAGTTGSPLFVLETNLKGAINCFEFARKSGAFVIFLSTSRIYSIEPLTTLPLRRIGDRFVPSAGENTLVGLTTDGISEKFPIDGRRSFYGASKLAAELLLHEYADAYGVRGAINRCGVICGEGQWGKTDQGIFTLWMARHFFGGELSYTGFGGEGLQVRDLLHPEDLFELFHRQLDAAGKSIPIVNVGGGMNGSVSLLEYTALCEEISGKSLGIGSSPVTSRQDIPWYISDNSQARALFGWEPKIPPREIAGRVHAWLRANEKELKPYFASSR